jgi:mono/diheme cytochrome c family protein
MIIIFPRMLRAFLLFSSAMLPSSSVVSETDNPVPSHARPAAVLYRQFCAQCHGADHKGRAVRERGEYIPDFTQVSWHARHDEARLLVSILEGKGERMPPFSENLSKFEARALVFYLVELGPVPARTGATNPSDFVNRFTVLEQEFDMLRQQFYDLQRRTVKP